VKLDRRYVEKPWGRAQLPPIFDAPAGKRIGEVWFTGGSELPLLAKYIFTSERLSIQVHPNDEQARARGLPQGKSECWYILDAEPDAVLGLGLTREVAKDELRHAALDGSIEQLVDWRPIAAGDFIFVPAGIIHAIGAGISLLEFQQNSDITYRLYDYGRPRELHLDDGIAVADPRPFGGETQHLSNEERVLVNGTHFRLACTARDIFEHQQRWVIPIEGEVRTNGDIAAAGDCLLVRPGERVELENARLLIGATA
jgi:mannose-6-phosphate isomerase